MTDALLIQDLAEIDCRHRWQLRPPKIFPSRGAVAWGFDLYGLWQTFSVKGVEFKLRYIPPGRFVMGSPKSEPGRLPNELQHVVTLTNGFWLGETAVTQILWQAIMVDNPSHFKSEGRAELPVETVSWDDCQVFFDTLNKVFSDRLDGLVSEYFTFPTEAQWEYACRAGSRTVYATGDRLSSEEANYGRGWDDGTVDVKQFLVNAWGLYQMHGNVYEWCLDGQREYQAHPVINPVGDLESSKRVLRGGCWIDFVQYCRSANRDAYLRYDRGSYVGLRVAMILQANEAAS